MNWQDNYINQMEKLKESIDNSINSIEKTQISLEKIENSLLNSRTYESNG